MAVWFTSDIHFSHEKIREYCPARGVLWPDSWTMNEGLLERYNAVVQPDDFCYVLGDVCMGNLIHSIPFVSRLNGTKYPLEGNHDRKALKREEFRKNFEWIKTDHEEEVEVSGRKISLKMRHYPPGYEELTVKDEHEHRIIVPNTYFAFGHRHNNVPHNPKLPCLDVGVDAQNLQPISREQVLEHIRIYLAHLDAGEVTVPFFELPSYDVER